MIATETQELDILLAISQTLATVHQPEDLLRTVSARLQPMFGFGGVVVLVPAGAGHHRYLFPLLPPAAATHPQLVALTNQTYADPDSAYAWMQQLPLPCRMPLTEYAARTTPPPPGTVLLQELGLSESLGAGLRHGGQLVGFLWFHYAPGQVRESLVALFGPVADLLAGPVASLLAHQELLNQEQEVATQFALTNALVLARSGDELTRALANEMSRLLPYHFLTLQWLHPHAPRAWLSGVQRLPSGELRDVRPAWDIVLPKIETLLAETLRMGLPQPAVLVGEDFSRACDAFELFRFGQVHEGLSSVLHIPMELPHDVVAVLVLGSQRDFAFTETDLALVMQLVPQITLALENLLSLERIQALTEQLEREKTYLMEEVKATHNFDEIIGSSQSLLPVFRLVEQVAATDATVLILGETGTGKELIARALHQRSPRHRKPLIKVNCAALPAHLIESELFGHEKGAFTGAHERRLGKFELAHGGTIFLDEVGELPLELQAKLLRVLQEKEIERLGGKGMLAVDVRVVAATNRDLSLEITAERFRADLYYRLSVFPITLPALRERREDIPLLADHFARRFSRGLGRAFAGIKDRAMQELVQYDWPGNIREMQNLLEQATIVCDGPLEWSRLLSPGTAPEPAAGPAAVVSPNAALSLKGHERDHILAVLRQTKGRIRGAGGAAELLDVNPTTLDSRIKRLKINKADIFR